MSKIEKEVVSLLRQPLFDLENRILKKHQVDKKPLREKQFLCVKKKGQKIVWQSHTLNYICFAISHSFVRFGFQNSPK